MMWQLVMSSDSVDPISGSHIVSSQRPAHPAIVPVDAFTQAQLRRRSRGAGRCVPGGGVRASPLRAAGIARAAGHHAAGNGGELTPGVRVVIEQGYRRVRAPGRAVTPDIVFRGENPQHGAENNH
jgi:hypothetical protein